MSYASEREYTRVQGAIVICEYIRRHKRITLRKARELTGFSRFKTWRVLLEIEQVLGMYREGTERVLLEEESPTPQ